MHATPFSLIYGAETVVCIEVMVLSAQLALVSRIADLHDRIYDVDALEERRQSGKSKCLCYRKQITRADNKKVRP